MRSVRGLVFLVALALSGCTEMVNRIPPDLADLIEGARLYVSSHSDYRTYDGMGNNQSFFAFGAVGTTQLRFPVNYYSDGVNSPTQDTRDPAAPRIVSNAVHDSGGFNLENEKGVSDFFWLWGQFIDHDITLTPQDPGKEAFDIGVPRGDIHFDPFNTGTATIPFTRSAFQVVDGVRSQFNDISAFLDASMVYGSSESRGTALRAVHADGTLSANLATSPGDYMPYNVNLLLNEPADNHMVDHSTLFLAGDVRANENVALTAMHTLFVREHNFIVGKLREWLPGTDEETLYQTARAIVGAEIQAITYREFLPLLLGDVIPAYTGYKSGVNPGIHLFFSTVAFRFGHTMVSPFILRRDRDGNVVPQGDLALRDAFFRDVPEKLLETGLEPVFIGLETQKAKAIDPYIIDDMRNFLFGPPGSGGLDLAALNIQRSRDHGLPQYNEARRNMGLLPVGTFGDVSSKIDIQQRLALAYTGTEAMDSWTGCLSEDKVPGAMVGPLAFASIRDQFIRLRDGDRFWYQSHLPPGLVRWAEKSTLSEIIRRNTTLFDDIGDNVFLAK